jgi:uncharacterized tellurite resistance protein B-like protein
MNNKYIVKILNEDGTVRREEYFKTIKDISDKYNVDGHILRDIIKISEGKKVKKFIHSQNELIYKTFNIQIIKPSFDEKIIYN